MRSRNWLYISEIPRPVAAGRKRRKVVARNRRRNERKKRGGGVFTAFVDGAESGISSGRA